MAFSDLIEVNYENCREFMNQGPAVKIWNWGQYKCDLKGEYKSEHAGEVKTYKLSKQELVEYLKKFK